MSTKRKSTTNQPSSPLSFQFVNSNPLTQRERTSLQTLVRTNATNKYWRQRKKAAALARLQSSSTQILAPMSSTDKAEVDGELAYSGPDTLESRGFSALKTISKLYQISPPTSMNSIGVGQLDPFEMYPSELPMHVVNPVLSRGECLQIVFF